MSRRYIDKPEWHRHKCQECGAVWEHPDTYKGNDEAHLCPRCGKKELSWYFGRQAQDCQHPEAPCNK